MSLLWKLYELNEGIKHRRTLTKCSRCHSHYKKNLEACPICIGVNDKELELLLKEQTNERDNIGKAMLSFVAIFFVLLILIYGTIYYYNT